MTSRYTAIAVLLAITLTASAAPRPSQIRQVTNDPARVADLRRASSDTREFAQSVAQALWLVAAGDEAEPARRARMAGIVAAAIAAAGEDAPAFATLLAERVSAEMLPVVTAAAVLVAGNRSPEMLEALILGAGGSQQVREALTGAARRPAAVLGRGTLLALRPTGSGDEPEPVSLSDSGTTSTTDTGESDPAPVATGDPLPPPPRPSQIPPRPPAIPYRGQ